MRCQVLLFAHLRESIGRDRIWVELPNGSTVGDLLSRLHDQHEVLAKLQGRVAVAVDERYEQQDAPLRDGCTVALIPPVSGG